ncbi:MAG TPA: glycosyltransferase [Candidatus Methylomirabilis sp.]|nr:glycosyltransferase [Candidatus Methylomirabilis sp.]
MGSGVRLEDLAPPQAVTALDAVGSADLLVGVPVLNQVRSITQVVASAAAGLAKHFPALKTQVLVADTGSQDGTLAALRTWRETAASTPPLQDVRLTGPPQRGRAILAILAAAERLKARGCVLLDADLVSATDTWMDQLLTPVLREEADFVSPAYTRAVSEGTLTTNLLAPWTRALYGKRIQQPVGGCVGLSAGLVNQLLRADIWTSDLAAHGPDLSLTTEALVSGARLVETHLGRKIVEASSAQPDLATTVTRVVGSLFRLMERHHAVWEEIRGSVPLPRTGEPAGLLPETGGVQGERMVRAFRLGLKDLLPVWEQIMPEETLTRLYPLGLLAVEEFQLPPVLWARVVCDFALAFHERRLSRDHLVRALTPLYLGRVAAFLLEAQTAPASRLPVILENIDRAFEEEKERLRARWR